MLKQFAKLGKFLGLFLLCFTLVVGCNQTKNTNQTTTPQPQANNDRITIGTTLKPRTIDPADSYELSGLNIIYNLGETLYTYKLGTTELEPLLATEMPKVSEDGLTYTIPLRQGVMFHDGTPFNGEAMAFSLERFIKNGGKPSFLLADVVDSIKATNESEITIKLKQPFAAFPSLLAFTGTCAVSPQTYKIGAGEFVNDQFVGTGAYKLAEFKTDSLSLDINENYWGEKPSNQGVNLQIYASNSANLYNGFRTGAVAVAYQSLDPEQIKSLQDNSSQWQIIEAAGTAVNYLVLNLQQKPLDQLEVRQAIAALVDRNLLNERVLQGQAEPVYSLIPTAFSSYKPVFKDSYGDANFSKAKELLTKAGYTANNPAIVEIWHPSGSTTRSIVAQTLKALAEKEIEGLLQIVPKSIESASFFGNIGKGLYPAALVDWYPDFLDADNYIQPFLSCTKGSMTTGCQEGASQSRGSFYYSDRANQLIDQERQESSTEKRQQIFAQIQDLLAEDVAYVPLWQTKDYIFAQTGVTGVTINPSQNLPFWKITKNRA